MKNTILFVLLFTITQAYAQTKKDPAVLAFIKSKPFVALTDTTRLPDAVKKFHAPVLLYMKNHNMNPADYYVWETYVRDQQGKILVPLCHYDGFVVLMKNEEENKTTAKNRKEGEPVVQKDINGNLSGRDGNMEIDKKTGRVLAFRYWQ